MKKVFLVLALIIFTSPAYSLDSEGLFLEKVITCNQVVEAHASYEDNGSTWLGKHKTHWVMGYIEGYMSGTNQWKLGKKDWYKGQTVNNVMNWVASYCKSKPSHSLHEVLEIFSK